MGPMSDTFPGESNAERHAKCRDKERCHGPGCKVTTGKTRAKRDPKTFNRDDEGARLICGKCKDDSHDLCTGYAYADHLVAPCNCQHLGHP